MKVIVFIHSSLMMLFLFMFLLSADCFLMNYKAPIVFASECDHLKTQLAEASFGNKFVLLTDLATDHHTAKEPVQVRDNLRFILQLSLLTRFYTRVPVVQLDTTYTQYLSDENKLRYSAHDDVVQCLNLVRGFIQGGIGNINYYEDWNVVESKNKKYTQSVLFIQDCLRFMDTFSIRHPLTIDNYYVGHAANIIPYEKNLTRNDSVSNNLYACSSHFLWLETLPDPLMTNHLSQVQNPIGIVATDTISPSVICDTISLLNPQREPGKITIMVRMKWIHANLPTLIQKLGHHHHHNVVWCCDPKNHKNLYDFLQILKKYNKTMGGLWVRGRDLNTINFVSKYLYHYPKKNPDNWNKFSL